jgi:hypothetical protein
VPYEALLVFANKKIYPKAIDFAAKIMVQLYLTNPKQKKGEKNEKNIVGHRACSIA